MEKRVVVGRRVIISSFGEVVVDGAKAPFRCYADGTITFAIKHPAARRGGARIMRVKLADLRHVTSGGSADGPDE